MADKGADNPRKRLPTERVKMRIIEGQGSRDLLATPIFNANDGEIRRALCEYGQQLGLDLDLMGDMMLDGKKSQRDFALQYERQLLEEAAVLEGFMAELERRWRGVQEVLDILRPEFRNAARNVRRRKPQDSGAKGREE